MNNNKVSILESSYIICEGLKGVLKTIHDFQVTGEFGNFTDLEKSKSVRNSQLIICNPDLIKANTAITKLKIINPNLKILVIDSQRNPQKEYLNPAMVDGYIFLCCHTEEVLKAVISVASGEKFFCNKALDFMIQPKAINSCNPVNLSAREIEILKLIAKGLSSNEISEQLCLSFHTITTHRKNICRKLDVSKVSELIAFAHKNNLVS